MARVKVPVPVEKTEAAAPPPEPKPDPTPPPVEQTPAPEPVQTLSQDHSEQRSPRFSNQQLIIGGFGLILLILLVSVVNLTKDRNRLEKQVGKSGSSASASTEDVKQLTAQIGQFFQLPTGETPTLATVTDINKVKGQSFFKNARNGDKVLLYSKAGQAILYRPSTKKMINVAPVNLNEASTNGASSTGTGSDALPAPAQ